MIRRSDKPRLAVIGAGPAGMIAAKTAAEYGVEVLLFERNERCGRKLRITGKGRCNLTNNTEREEFLKNVPTNPKFLYAALSRFSPADTMALFEEAGVPLKTERGRRVFPVSDKATDIVDAMVAMCKKAGVQTIREKVVELCARDSRICAVKTEKETYEVDGAILCTGGASYPQTGSDGQGYELCRALGHTVVTPSPSLVPLTSRDGACPKMQGLSLKNVALKIINKQTGKCVFEDFGEMMFTHFGMTGPLILSASSHITSMKNDEYFASIDLKPALDERTLDARLLSDFAKYSNRDFANALDDLLPQKMIAVVIKKSGIDPRKKVNSITKEERHSLLSVIKALNIPIWGFRPIAEAIITHGGVSTSEINPKTLESKLCRSLYFAGEIIDVDAYTGGYNLQIAFSSGVLAGESAAFALLSEE